MALFDHFSKCFKMNRRMINFDFITKKNGGHGDSIIFGYKYAINEGYDYIIKVETTSIRKLCGSRLIKFLLLRLK